MSLLSSDPQALPAMESLQAQTSPRPRVVIIGAGMSGLSAAHRLSTLAPSHFDLTVIEASNRIGGRIYSTTFNGELVEMGATWIHGIEGSPIHDIAQRMGLMQGDVPWECMDGFPESPVVIAEGGVQVHPHLVDSVGDLYKKLYDLIQYTDGGLQQFCEFESGAPIEKFKQLKEELRGESVGTYMWEGFKMHAALQDKNSLCNRAHSNGNGPTGEKKKYCSWNENALREGVFRMRENVERSVTAAASLNDLNMECNDEYWEYPGEHKTIGHGYWSVIRFLATSLPPKTIQFNKEVTKIAWLNHRAAPVHIQCLDGTSFEADHVIITVSLGVLKAEAHAKCVQLSRLFHPPLPPWKLHAISKLGFGVVDKCFLLMKPSVAGATYPHMQLVFREVQDAHNGHGLADVPWWMRKNFSFYPVHKSSHVVCTWLTGEEAMEMEGLSDEEVIDGVVRTMESFGFRERMKSFAEGKMRNGECDGVDVQGILSGMHGGFPRVEGIARSRWGSNPLFRGSYSYVAVGSTGEDIDTLAEPLPKSSSEQGHTKLSFHCPLQLLFAGEATHRYCYSTTHGAFLSGVREAERLVKHYGAMGSNG